MDSAAPDPSPHAPAEVPPAEVPPAEVPPVALWPRRPRLISVVCPVYNEAEGIAYFVESLVGVLEELGLPFEILLIDDDSADGSFAILQELHREYPGVKAMTMSRRFGHQPSLAAGFRHASGDVVICMDSDMQHPPDLLPTLLHRWAEGYQVVYTRRRSQAGALKNAASRAFYRLMDKVSDVPFEEGTADFRLMDRVVVEALKSFGERNLLYRGLVNWIGFERTAVEFDASERHAGTTSYSWKRMLEMGVDGLFAFSLLPLRFAFMLGAILMLVCWIYGGISIVGHLLGWFDAPGYTSLVLLGIFLASLNLIFVGVVGEYVGRIHEQVKQRPLYLVKAAVGFDPKDPSLPHTSPPAEPPAE